MADAAAEWLPEMAELVHLDISVEAHSHGEHALNLSTWPQFNQGKIRWVGVVAPVRLFTVSFPWFHCNVLWLTRSSSCPKAQTSPF